jgi:hypothetical protein
MGDVCDCGNVAVWFSLRALKHLCLECAEKQRAEEKPFTLTAESVRKCFDAAMKADLGKA